MGASAIDRTSASAERISSSNPGSVGGCIGIVGRAARRIGGRVSREDWAGALVGWRRAVIVGASGSGGSGGRSNAGDDADDAMVGVSSGARSFCWGK
jgi:hypothetical protein